MGNEKSTGGGGGGENKVINLSEATIKSLEMAPNLSSGQNPMQVVPVVQDSGGASSNNSGGEDSSGSGDSESQG